MSNTTTTKRNPYSLGKYEGNGGFGYMRAAVIDGISHDWGGQTYSDDSGSSATTLQCYGKAYIVWEDDQGFVTVVEYPTLRDANVAAEDWMADGEYWESEPDTWLTEAEYDD